YATDTGGQVWRFDLDPTMRAANPGNSTGARLAAISTAGTPEDERRFFYPVDVAELNDNFFSSEPKYDAIAIGSGYRAHPNDAAVYDRLYVFRDYQLQYTVALDPSTNEPTNYPLCNTGGSLAACDNAGTVVPLTEADLVDVTDNKIQDGTAAEQDAEKLALQNSNGWFIELKEDDGTYIGEKTLAKPIILDGVVYFTTYIPAGAGDVDPCQAREGNGRLYAVGLNTGEAVFDFNGDSSLSKGDRVLDVGGGIPSEVVPIFQDAGVTLLIGTGGGARDVDPGIGLPRIRSYWHQSFK
ncbi:MAG: hypothetical protein OEN20_07860, partial [Gammaproteobacteria bacterium]|nr:hypothetical protein [Gammaproteobacteria bacterium]